ncbi:unnamed protein product [Alopecurus aequalis]
MDTKKQCYEDNAKAGLESPSSKEIIQSLCRKKPVDTQFFLDRFTQDVIISDECFENFADSNIEQMHEEDANIHSFQQQNEENNIKSASNNHSSPQGQLNDEDIEDALNLEPPTAEEKDMDKMFTDNKYPTIQEISEAHAPEVGMEFDSREEAFFLFAVYARRMGFAIRKDTSYESKVSNVINRQLFTCNKSRSEKIKDTSLQQRRTNRIDQTKCKVRMTIKEERGKWSITAVHLEHNHGLAPSDWIVRFMRCHRHMSEADKTLISMLQETRVPPRNIMAIFRKIRGSFRGVPFDTKYLNNQLTKERQKIKNQDVEELLKNFKQIRHTMPGFSYRMEVDGNNTVRSVFWTDEIGKANYRKFGHFVSFDTTLSTNQYDLPFASIVGVDNYGKTILFGAAFLKDEKEDAFRWLFTEFVDVMGNSHPETIITDQDVAMGNAISAVLPFTIHRYCNFHIGRKMKQKLLTFFAARGEFYEKLKSLMRNSFSPNEFETGWHELLEVYNAQGEAHLERIFDIRAQWVPAFFMDKFFPFTSSTARSESTNSLFKSYVKRKDSTSTFFKQYLLIQEKKQADLDRLREKTELKQTGNWGYNPMEKEAAKVYTDPIYAKFAEEMKKTTAYNIEVVEQSRRYRVIRLVNYGNAEFPRGSYMVDVSSDGTIYTCTCSKMSRDGIQCCHVLKVALHHGLQQLPISFINPRCTTAVGIEVANMTTRNNQTPAEKTHLAVRHAIEMSKVSHLLSTVCTDDRSFDMFGSGIVQLKRSIIDDRTQRLKTQYNANKKRRAIDDPLPPQDDAAHANMSSGKFDANLNQIPHPEQEPILNDPIENTVEVDYRDPPQSKKHSNGLVGRAKSHYEKAAQKKSAKRKCSLCRVEGHRRLDCPDKDKVKN